MTATPTQIVVTNTPTPTATSNIVTATPTQIGFRGSSPYFKVDFDRYTGAGTCVWCHPEASRLWHAEESFHVQAYELLDEEARGRPECVKCHVTAFNLDDHYPLEDEAKRDDRELGFTWGGDPVLNARFTPAGALALIESTTLSHRSNTGRAVLATAG